VKHEQHVAKARDANTSEDETNWGA